MKTIRGSYKYFDTGCFVIELVMLILTWLFCRNNWLYLRHPNNGVKSYGMGLSPPTLCGKCP